MTAVVPALLARYDGNLPRYTSYPTAARFSDAVGPAEASRWLEEIQADEALSLYFHIPFCDELCRFCGCNTSVMRHESGRSDYGGLLLEELERVHRRLTHAAPDGRPAVTHVQFGGGTPTTLPEAAFQTLLAAVREKFAVTEDAELAVELDPRHFTPDMASFLGRLGFTRGSLGVQDLDPAVQEACGRHQSFDQTQACVDALREAGFRSVNIDLIYGLPYQTEASVAETARQIAFLRPDRLAVFGYAHVPWKQKRQQLMPEDALPGSLERIVQRETIDRVLQAGGYEAIGLDHYALPTDSMARAVRDGTLRRNFQGYTTDRSSWLIGMGASAISSLPGGFTQNVVSAAAYARALAASPTLPVARGVACTAEDRVTAALIERLMCDLSVDLTLYGSGTFAAERERLVQFEADGLVEWKGSRLHVTEAGRPFLRNVAAVFDRYIPAAGLGAGQHSRAI